VQQQKQNQKWPQKDGDSAEGRRPSLIERREHVNNLINAKRGKKKSGLNDLTLALVQDGFCQGNEK